MRMGSQTFSACVLDTAETSLLQFSASQRRAAELKGDTEIQTETPGAEGPCRARFNAPAGRSSRCWCAL
jgi:hypothetical protein